MTEAGRTSSVSDFKVIWCFVHVCVGVNKTFYKTVPLFLLVHKHLWKRVQINLQLKLVPWEACIQVATIVFC